MQDIASNALKFQHGHWGNYKPDNSTNNHWDSTELKRPASAILISQGTTDSTPQKCTNKAYTHNQSCTLRCKLSVPSPHATYAIIYFKTNFSVSL